LDPVLDLLVVGSGVAGLTAAVRAATEGLRVGVVTKGALEQSTTRWAQGGVAAVLGEDPDSTDLHLADTLRAGAGLCDADAVRVLVDEGPARVNELIALGAAFDRDPDGALQLAREGGHSMPRVVHAGGAATGVEIERALVAAVRRSAALIFEHAFALDLIVEHHLCRGVVAADAAGRSDGIRAAHTLLASGGAGQLFSVTTNPVEATGDGVAMALRAGVAVADVEFVQFHPTALHHPQMPRPLLSEAMRGHGAVLRDARGERFVDELAPRDVVARAMAERLAEHGSDHLWLDATGLADVEQRFPTIVAAVRAVGLDPGRDWLPIAPAAHYLCGGVITDLSGATALPRLWAAGEVACSGVHGANRLASNSLLEGMVFAARVVEAIEAGREEAETTGAMRARDSASEHIDFAQARIVGVTATAVRHDPVKERDLLQRAMTAGAGVVRTALSLATTASALHETAVGENPELRNLLDLASAVIVGAQWREESRGAHTRADFPDRSSAFERRLLIA
jgi:L-aspartate oxidase